MRFPGLPQSWSGSRIGVRKTDERVRRARPADVPAIVELVYGLAEYERAPDECRLTAEQLETALFGDHPAAFCHVAEHEGEVAGCAIWFLSFSTSAGRPRHLPGRPSSSAPDPRHRPGKPSPHRAGPGMRH